MLLSSYVTQIQEIKVYRYEKKKGEAGFLTNQILLTLFQCLQRMQQLMLVQNVMKITQKLW